MAFQRDISENVCLPIIPLTALVLKELFGLKIIEKYLLCLFCSRDKLKFPIT